MAWAPLSPWRRRKAIHVPWASVRSISELLRVRVDGAEDIVFGVSQRRCVRSAIEECGMVWHRHPWDREAPDVALWAGEEPGWGLVAEADRVEP